jgi:hypothetical protein
VRWHPDHLKDFPIAPVSRLKSPSFATLPAERTVIEISRPPSARNARLSGVSGGRESGQLRVVMSGGVRGWRCDVDPAAAWHEGSQIDAKCILIQA